jgi:hypothetical protein
MDSLILFLFYPGTMENGDREHLMLADRGSWKTHIIIIINKKTKKTVRHSEGEFGHLL